METKGKFYSEIQRYSSAWVWLILFGLSLSSFIYMVLNYHEGMIPDNKINKQGLIIMGSAISFMFIMLFFLFSNMRMELNIGSDGISFRYPILKMKFDLIEKANIESFKVREYKPMKEFGGWGYKKVSKKRNKIAHNVSGNIGLEVFLTNGKTIMFGTKRKDAISFAMNKMMEGR